MVGGKSMCDRKISFFVLLLSLLLFSCTAKAEPKNMMYTINGTWVDYIGYKNSPKIHDVEYSWGKAKRIVETTLEFDINMKIIRMPGNGLFYIQNIQNQSNKNIALDLISSYEPVWEMKIVIHFIDKDTFWIECPDLEGIISVGRDQPWYRLSGPTQ